MTQPVRVQRSRRKGSKLESPNGLPVVCVSRGTKWGNPFKVSESPRPFEALTNYRAFLFNTAIGAGLRAAALRELRGKNLACWCKLDAECHADVLLELANS